MGLGRERGGRLRRGFLVGVGGVIVSSCGDWTRPGESSSAAPHRSAESAWVRTYDPSRADNGYTLTLWRREEPVLLDMQGRIVHRWPDVRMKSRVRLLPGGSILGIGRGRAVLEVDWHGRTVWSHRTEGAFPHHDVVRLANGNTLVVLKVPEDPGDVLEEVAASGEVMWRWIAMDHLSELLPAEVEAGDVTHINSVQELPENPWFAAGDERFRPGNILVSARNLNMALIVDRSSSAVVWSTSTNLDHQHEALMNPPDSSAPGWIQIFNNRRRSFGSDRQSEILEIDPISDEVRWRYRTPGFFTSTGGTQQLLGNDNMLITSTRGRRVFEVDRDGGIAWEWTPPFQPVRALRYRGDFDPLLRSLPRSELHAVQPTTDAPYLDPETYRFARRGARRQIKLDGHERTVLREPSTCRNLPIPEAAELQLAWGVDVAGWRRSAGLRAMEFVVRIDASGALEDVPVGTTAPRILLRDRVQEHALEAPLWRTADLDLSDLASTRVRLCVAIEALDAVDGPGDVRFGYWQQPVIVSTVGPGLDEQVAGSAGEEEEVRREHLRTMGYVD